MKNRVNQFPGMIIPYYQAGAIPMKTFCAGKKKRGCLWSTIQSIRPVRPCCRCIFNIVICFFKLN